MALPLDSAACRKPAGRDGGGNNAAGNAMPVTPSVMHPAIESEIIRNYQPTARPPIEIGGMCDELVHCLQGATPTALVPILGWFPKFLRDKPLRSVVSDLMVGITVAAVVVPQGMAYGMLSGLPPVYGLYTATLPPLAYTVFGSCMHLAVGPFALIAMLSAAGVHNVVENPSEDVEGAIAASAVIALLSGLALLIAGILRLGFIATFLSDSALSGYTTAVSIIIPTSQMKYAFQLKVSRGTFVSHVSQLATELMGGGTNWASFGIFAVSFALIVALQQVNASPRCAALKKYPIPAELAVVVLSTAACFLLNLHQRCSVDVLGEIPQGLPAIKMPDLERFPLHKLVSPVLVVSLMTYITAMSVSKTFARKFGYEVDNNQELIALGCANLLGSVSSSFPAAASLSRTAIIGASGASTPLHNFWTVAVLVMVMLFCGPLLQTLPLAALAAVVVVAFKSLLLSGIAEAQVCWRVSTSDFLVWNVAFWSTLFTTVTWGIAIAVGANLFFLFWKATLPSHAVLGRLEGTERIYRNRRLFEHAHVIEGIMLFRFDAPLHFANREAFATQLMRNLLQHDAELSGTPFDERATFWGGVRALGARLRKRPEGNGAESSSEESSASESGESDGAAAPRLVKAIVVDFSPVGHIDISAVRALEKLRGELAARGTRIVLAHCKFPVHEKLASMGLFDRFELTGRFDVVCFRELHDAVLFAEGRLEVAVPADLEDDGDEERPMTPSRTDGVGALSSLGRAVSDSSTLSHRRSNNPRAEYPRQRLRARSTVEQLEEQGLAVGANELGPYDVDGRPDIQHRRAVSSDMPARRQASPTARSPARSM